MPYDNWKNLKPVTFYWSPLIKNREVKVIFNNPATILYINGEKYVSKVHNEEFDEEKGLLMCLAKANGISNLELQRMIKGAKRIEPSKIDKKVD